MQWSGSSAELYRLDRQAESRDIALLGALCLFLSALDHVIPKPLPFMRLGLANLPLLIALDIFTAKHFFLLALIKVFGQSLITGTLFSYILLFSLVGTGLSAVCMFILRRITYKGKCIFSLAGIGIIGAFASNSAQLLLARYLVFGYGISFLAPPFLAAGIVSGAVLGFFAEAFSRQSQWLRLQREKAVSSRVLARQHEPTAALDSSRTFVFSIHSIFLLCLAAFFLLVPYLPVRAALCLLFFILAYAMGKKPRPVLMLISIIMISLCNLYPPFGKILFTGGPRIIAEGSLIRGLQRAVTMAGLIMFSKIALSAAPPFPGKIGLLLQESFAILEQLNREFSIEKSKRENIKTEKLMEKIDKTLCRISGFNYS